MMTDSSKSVGQGPVVGWLVRDKHGTEEFSRLPLEPGDIEAGCTAQALCIAASADVIPAGWKLVPEEPTAAMLTAGGDVVMAAGGIDPMHADDRGAPFHITGRESGSGRIYAAMLVAAPELPPSPSIDPEVHRQVVEALRKMVGGECPSCRGWGEVAYMGELVRCECNGEYRCNPSDAVRAEARAALSLAGEVR